MEQFQGPKCSGNFLTPDPKYSIVIYYNFFNCFFTFTNELLRKNYLIILLSQIFVFGRFSKFSKSKFFEVENLESRSSRAEVIKGPTVKLDSIGSAVSVFIGLNEPTNN